MANSSKEPAPTKAKAKGGKPEEMSMEIRLVLTFLLMGVVLFLTPYFLKTTPPPTPPPKKTQTPAAVKEEPSRIPPKPAPAASRQEAEPVGQVVATREDDRITVETDLYRVQFSNRGAVARSWVLKRYLDNNRKPIELVNAVGGTRLGFPFHLIFKGAPVQPDPNQGLFVATRTADGFGIDFEFSDGKLHVKKSFRFEKNRYLVQVATEAREQGRPAPHLAAWRGGFGDFSAVNALSAQRTLYFDANQNKLIVNDVSAAKNGPVSATGSYLFAGLEDTYFTAVTLPAPDGPFEVQTWSEKLPLVADPNKEEPHIGVALGGDGVNRFSVFIGPKDIDILRSVDRRLEQVVDFGWFWFLAKPLFGALHYVNDRYIHNYGWSIILVTILINILLLPLKVVNLKSMKKMAQIQPQIQAIQAKYSNLSMRDPKKQQQQQETMELYKKHGVNPLGGCVPMLLQIPFFFAFYKVLTVTIEMRGASWLWVMDLSQPEHLAIRALPLATVATQFILQKMTPSTTADPQQQRIMMLMPLMFIFVFYSVASGLVLYWLTGNVVGIVQQWFFNKTMGIGRPAPAAAPKKTGRK
ncbi:MAG: membrane protein insertase YidC [Acidobacteria bacterium]|nr:membrane protein insertase YidC [Acidobacteriota bacterium]